MKPNILKPTSSSEVRRPSLLPDLFRSKVGQLLGASLLATTVGCSGNVDDPTDAEPQKTYFSCEASGHESSIPVSEWAITPMYTSDTLEAVEDTNPDSRVFDLNHTGEAPLDQSSYYKCEFQGGENCFFTVNPLPNTKYEAAHLETATYIKWKTNWLVGEATSLSSDDSLARGNVALVHVVLDPQANGSCSAQITLNPKCE